MLKIIGFVFLGLIILLAVLIISILLFIKFGAVFGGKISAAKRKEYEKSPHYQNGKFHQITTYIPEDVLPDFGNPVEQQRHGKVPTGAYPYEKIKPESLQRPPQKIRVTWMGHSILLIEAAGKKVLIDPMFSKTPSPIQGLGGKRFAKEMPISIQDLPIIDVVLITHDHYDHLDYVSIKKIKNKVKTFLVPLGISAHLLAWGVKPEQIEELDWWQDSHCQGLDFTLTPSHHYSGRQLNDRFATLWGGWIIATQDQKIYLTGDGGYGNHFKEVGRRYGPFDLAMVECGQYYRAWAQNHMIPEQSVQAVVDCNAKLVLPIHWGAFKLAFHPWSEPINRFLAKAPEFHLDVLTPLIGQSFVVGQPPYPQAHWWKEIE